MLIGKLRCLKISAQTLHRHTLSSFVGDCRMFERFHGKDRTIVAGIKFTPGTKDFLSSLISLAERTDMSLKLTHVVEPWRSPGIVPPGEYVSPYIVRQAEEKRLKEAQETLEYTVKNIQGKIPLSTHVLSANAADGIRSDALTSRASLVVCSIKPMSHRFIPQGFSTALAMMAQSTIPIMVIPEEKNIRFTQDRLTILICDDLTETSAEAVTTAAEFAGSLQNCNLVHLHVHPEPTHKLVEWAVQISQMSQTKDLTYGFPIRQETIVEETEQAIRKKLTERLLVPAYLLEQSKVSYEQKTKFGSVFEEITSVVKSIKPDLIVFGRHYFVHKHPVSIGKVPFYAMLSLDTPVMVISNLARLR